MRVVLQDGIKDCGICCLLSIIRHYGGEVPKEYLRELTNTTKEGVSLYYLLEASKKLGFDAYGATGKIEEMEVNNLPCIAHINVKNNYKHFIVIYKINTEKRQITVMDPSKGKKVLSFSEFHLLSSNNYLFLKPKKKIPILKKKNIIIKTIINITKKNKKAVLFIFLLTVNHFILNIISSFHFKYLIKYVVQMNTSNNLVLLCVFITVIYLIKNIINSIRDVLLNKWNTLFNIEITTHTYKQILLLPYFYYKNRTTGEILSRFQDLNKIKEYLIQLIYALSIDSISCIIFLCLMFDSIKQLAYMVLTISLITSLISIINSVYKRKVIKKIKTREDLINSYLIQGISNVDTIKGCHLEKRFIDKFSINYKSFQESAYSYLNSINLELLIKNNIHDFLIVLIYGIGSFYIINRKLSLENLILFQVFMTYFLQSFQNIIDVFNNYHNFKIILDRIEELFMIDYEHFSNNYFYLPYTLKGDIVVNKLSYKIGTKVIFDNLSLTINEGDKVLLSGDSGSGKSTLVKMLMRYVETKYNTIRIADIDINHYHLQNIRANITYTTGNEYLFQDSLKNNICLFSEDDTSSLQKICDICMIDEILKSKNMTLESIIEENGFDLSNGERQRIFLARSLFKKTSIYIFDEALSGIDINKEKKILENIFAYLSDKTIIVISHRFNNKKLFNRILKLENGRICENKKL